MALSFFSPLQNLWPFSLFSKHDDLTISNQLIQRLSIPDQTKQFVFAFREPDSQAVIYILAVENLSEQSAIDSVHLIKEIQPKAVIAQIAPSALSEIQTEERCLNGGESNTVPTSSFGVLKKCFTDKLKKDVYEKIASSQVLQEIFGIGFYGHFLAAKEAAEEVNSKFLLLESPYSNANTGTGDSDITTEGEVSGQKSGLHLQANNLVAGGVTSTVNPNFQRLHITDALQSQMVKSLIPSLQASLSLKFSASDQKLDKLEPVDSFEAPPFAQVVYPLLADLYTIFAEIPSIKKALVSSQKMLECIHKGHPISSEQLSDVYTFRVAIEGLRIALANAAKSPPDKMGKSSSAKLEFSQLPSDEKCHVLFSQALKSQAKKFGSVVALVDAGSLCGIRRHWNTPLPSELEDVSAICFMQYTNEGETGTDEDNFTESIERKKKLSDKPMVAVGAGATAIIGASSLSKAIQASTLFKISSYKVPWVLKHGLAQLQRKTLLGLGKTWIPSNLSGLKFTLSAEKIRVVTHSVITSVERTSFLAMRTAFYEIMQKRGARSVRIMPWVTFGFSMSMCCGLLVYGDGIECVAESAPAVPSIASLGRGLESLKFASMEVRQTSGSKIQEALQSFMHNLRQRMRGR
ncbi:Chaperone protein ClpB 2 [Rhynchospora pubera]|uniref:Chaperone protein ClpB 2 n=1 Tax=Rhynchospora pubera TaxID=906938 RepID=A0AAV8HEP3_9POAL|nr:Chaperone protein ClpB 2 [Rhynchospora pubera]